MLRSVNGDGGTRESDTPSLSSTPRRPVRDEKNEVARIMAMLNTIASQNTTHSTMFESQKLQTNEIQLQLNDQHSQLSVLQDQMNTLREQQDRLIGLVENLAANATGSTHLVSSHLPKTSDASTYNITSQAELAKNTTIKPKRGPGRPRTRCTRCKNQKPLLNDSAICEECVHLPPPTRGRKRHLSPNEGLLTNQTLSKQPRLETSQDATSRIADDAHELDEDSDLVVVLSRANLQQRKSMIHVPAGENISSESGFQDLPERDVKVEKTLEDRQNLAETQAGPERAAERRSTDTGPFFEDLNNVHPSCSDIFDPDHPSGNEVSGSDGSSITHATSIAESIYTDELDVDSDEQQGEHRYPSRHYQTARTEERTRSSFALKANMAIKARKPLPNADFDGSKYDSHHKIAQKTDEPGWRAVNRRF
ncbi:MAG: hypothetical protein GOMPHAMPRED_002118 [Gomphillus americanus]|uniref:Uncharacterized protein n=1 Tax=Gomphillus americanus TaxID=1940652 RepID=A0A8H3FH10_9LECA|nr:MAG: hypothetical protein GOMPHAMPRED_002118 [Gomphillus americanus]